MKKTSKQSEYERSLSEFREILTRFSHKVKHRFENPRFLEDDRQTPPKSKPPTANN